MRGQILAFVILAGCSGSSGSLDRSGGGERLNGGLDTGGAGERRLSDLGSRDTSPSCPGKPIVAPEETWHWEPVPAALCGRGKSTGVGINITSRSSRLLIFLNGGGACYDTATCAPWCNPSVQLCAAYLDGFGESDLKTFLDTTKQYGGDLFDRNSAANPFRDWNWVFVPYCTGDLHSGSQKGTDGILHVGFTNMAKFLERIVPTFCNPSIVALAGSSAGGFGTVFNYAQVKKAFGGARIDLVDDSGPPLSTQAMPLQTTMRSVWGSDANIPPGCTACSSGWDKFLPFLAGGNPGARFSLLSYTADTSIGPAFGGPIATPQGFLAAINSFADQVVAPLPNARVFYRQGFDHVLLKSSLAQTTSAGQSLSGFLQAQVSSDPGWKSARP